MPKHEISNVRTRGTGAIEKLIFYKTEVSEHQVFQRMNMNISQEKNSPAVIQNESA